MFLRIWLVVAGLFMLMFLGFALFGSGAVEESPADRADGGAEDVLREPVSGCGEQEGLRATDGRVFICVRRTTGEEIVVSLHESGDVTQVMLADGTVLRP